MVSVIRRKPVLTHASIVCEGMLASVNSVNSVCRYSGYDLGVSVQCRRRCYWTALIRRSVCPSECYSTVLSVTLTLHQSFSGPRTTSRCSLEVDSNNCPMDHWPSTTPPSVYTLYTVYTPNKPLLHNCSRLEIQHCVTYRNAWHLGEICCGHVTAIGFAHL